MALQEFTSADEMKAFYKQLEQKKWARKAPEKPVVIEIADPIPEPEPEIFPVVAPEPIPEPEPEIPRRPAHDILREVAAKHGLKVDAIISRGRQRALVKARQEFCYRALEETLLAATQIGRIIKRDHTTALHNANAYCFLNNLPNPRGATWSLHKITRGAA